MASVSSFETDMRKLRRKRKRKRAVKNLMVIAAVVVVCLGIYLSRGLWLSYFEGILERGASAGSEEHSESVYPIDISKRVNVDIDSMENCWTMFCDTSLMTCNSDGTIINTLYVPYSNPVVETVQNRVLAYDMGGYNFIVATRRGEVYNKKLDNQILFAEMGEKGNAAVVTATEKYPSYLTVYDKNGTEIFRWADGNLITSVVLDDSGNRCAVSSIYAVGGSIKSVVSVLQFDKTEVVCKSAPIETMALDLEFTKDGGIWVIGDSKLLRLDDSCKVGCNYDYAYDLASFSAEKDVCALVFEKTGGKETCLSLFDADIDSATEITYNEKIKHIDVCDGLVYYNTASRLNAVDKNGIMAGTAELDSDCISFAVYENEILVLGYRSIEKIEFNAHG